MLHPVTIRVGSKELLGLEASWDAVEQRLARYSLVEIASWVGRLDALLRNAPADDSGLQQDLCDAFFGGDKRDQILTRLNQFAAALRPSETVALVAPSTCTSLMQIAVHALSDPHQEPTNTPPEAFGEALLMVNDLISKAQPSPRDVHPNAGIDEWAYFTGITAAVGGTEIAVHLVARAAELFLQGSESLRLDPHFVDLEGLFTETTGLPVAAYCASLFLLLAPTYRITALNAPQYDGRFQHSKLRNGAMDEAAIANFLALAGDPVDVFVRRMREYYPRGTLKPQDPFPMRLSPMIHFDQVSICLSAGLLEERLTVGLYHLLLNSKAEPRFRSRLLQFYGRLYEQLVGRACARIASSEQKAWKKLHRSSKTIRGRWIGEAELREALDDNEAPLCDGALKIGSLVVLIEAKSAAFPKDAKSGDRPGGYFEKLEDIAIRGAGQLDATVGHIAQGRLGNAGLGRNTVSRIVPVVVTLERLLMAQHVRMWLDRTTAKRSFLVARQVEDIRVDRLDIWETKDLELVELLTEQCGTRVTSLLERRHAKEDNLQMSLTSWAHFAGITAAIGRLRLRHATTIHNGMFEDALAYLRRNGLLTQ